jgi:DNA-binding transcriptional LysR family regulator
MTLQMIESFLAIVQYHSISLAANALYVSQSTISFRLQMLEKEIDAVLINRKKGTRGIELTQDGENFVPLAHQWLSLWYRMRGIKDRENEASLVIGGLTSLNDFILDPFFRQIVLNNPNMHLRIRTQHTSEIYQMLDSGEIDFGFAFYPIHYGNVTARPVFREKTFMVCHENKSFPPGPIHPSSLNVKDEFFLSWSPDIRKWHDYWWMPVNSPRVRVDRPSTLLSFLQENPMAWCLCPESVIEFFKTKMDVEIHEFIDRPPDRISYLLAQRKFKHKSNKGHDIFLSAFDSFLPTVKWAISNSNFEP